MRRSSPAPLTPQRKLNLLWQTRLLNFLGTGRRKTAVARVRLADRLRQDHRQRPRVRKLFPDRNAARRRHSAADADANRGPV